MSTAFVNSVLLLLMISTVVFNHKDYYEVQDDYDGQDYPSMERQWSRSGRRYRSNQMGYVQNMAGNAEDVGLVNSVLGIVAGGKCLIKCVISVTKICVKIFDCIWNCILPKNEIMRVRSVPKKSDDQDIMPRAAYSHSSDITPSDIVALVDCLRTCITRYLPRSLDSLFDWLTCITNKCICYG